MILADDMAYGLFGANRRFSFLNLPNLERMAAQGVQFNNAFVTTSLCSPSRGSILSGLYAHSHGVLINDSNDLAAGIATFPLLMQQAGYKTALVGKWHMSSATDNPRPGFDYWVSFKGQGVYENPVLNVNRTTVQRTGYLTDILTEYAVNWLRQNGTQQPFMLYLAHKAPHLPSEPMPRHATALAGDSIPEPATFEDTFKDKPEWQRRYVVCGGAAAAFSQCPDPLPAALPIWQWSPTEPWRLDYLRTLMDIDDSVGSIQNTLASLGIADSTYVLFLSDNGFLFGDHRMADKRVAYEESMRIPFVMSGGGLAPRQANGVALNIDVAPTLLELASVAKPATMQGLSLARLLRGEAESVRDAFLYEYFAEPLVPVVPSIQAIRSGVRKYVRYSGDAADEEFYDLVLDARELTNVAARPDWSAARDAARQQLDRLLAETGAPR